MKSEVLDSSPDPTAGVNPAYNFLIEPALRECLLDDTLTSENHRRALLCSGGTHVEC